MCVIYSVADERSNRKYVALKLQICQSVSVKNRRGVQHLIFTYLGASLEIEMGVLGVLTQSGFSLS